MTIEDTRGHKTSKGDTQLSFNEVVYLRKSCRGFLSSLISEEVLKNVLTNAQQSPSNCNTQPWVVHIVSGDKLLQLSQALQAANTAGDLSPDFSFDANDYEKEFLARLQDQGKVYYDALGIGRDDEKGRKEAADKNLTFFGAPYVALLFMPSVGDNVRIAGDIGMYAQTFLLSLTNAGLAGLPQTYLGMFAETIRQVLDISSEYRMMFGISFGYSDPNSVGNSAKLGREPISNSVIYHR